MIDRFERLPAREVGYLLQIANIKVLAMKEQIELLLK